MRLRVVLRGALVVPVVRRRAALVFLALVFFAPVFFAPDLGAADFRVVPDRLAVFLAVDFLAVVFFAVDFLAGVFFAVDFLAVDFLAVVFFAGAFLAVVFLAVVFLAVVFLAVVFFAGDFFAVDFFADDFFAVDFSTAVSASSARPAWTSAEAWSLASSALALASFDNRFSALSCCFARSFFALAPELFADLASDFALLSRLDSFRAWSSALSSEDLSSLTLRDARSWSRPVSAACDCNASRACVASSAFTCRRSTV